MGGILVTLHDNLAGDTGLCRKRHDFIEHLVPFVDVQHDFAPAADKNLFERRNPQCRDRTVVCLQKTVADRVEAQLRDFPFAVRRAVDRCVVHQDQNAVCRTSDIQFNHIDPHIDRVLQRFERVFHRIAPAAAMGHYEYGLCIRIVQNGEQAVDSRRLGLLNRSRTGQDPDAQ